MLYGSALEVGLALDLPLGVEALIVTPGGLDFPVSFPYNAAGTHLQIFN